MKFEQLALPGVMLVSLERHEDSRGFFSELVSTELKDALGFHASAQLNLSSSAASVFRGMHLQLPPFGQDKLVFCLSGSITDYVLDVSPGSSTFGQSIGVDLSDAQLQALFIPAHYAHGFLAGDGGAQVLYTVSQDRVVDHEISIQYASTSVAQRIQGAELILSDKDAAAMTLDEFAAEHPEHPVLS